MTERYLQFGSKLRQSRGARFVSEFLVPRAASVILWAALFCTLAVKLFHACRYGFTGEYFGWILADVSFLLAIEVVLSLVCYKWAPKWVVRCAAILAAVVCTWSVMNAGWLIRTGTQILPRVLLPLVRAPVSALCMIGVNLAEMPVAAVILLAPSAVALAFFFFALARAEPPAYDRRRFGIRIAVCVCLILAAIVARPALARRGSSEIAAVGLRYNAQLRALMSLVVPGYRSTVNPQREVPSSDELHVALKVSCARQNVVVVILEGVQYRHTSLGDKGDDVTPYLKTLAEQGLEFTNARSSLTHTTKALFALLTGRFASASQDIAEAVPVAKPYASLATIVGGTLGYRTAFFQSATGTFESRPGLVHNLGFDEFWARDDLNDPNSFLGYLGSDEFSMLEPIARWVSADERPFLLVVLCSATHDPYEVPSWFGEAPKEPLERYRQAIFYTDRFLAALDVEMGHLNIREETIFCVVGDHGEAFGEHGLRGHERIAFDEVLHIPFCVRAPFLVEGGRKVTSLVSSIDLTPTLLGLLGFETEGAGFEGQDLCKPVSGSRKAYFCGWMQEGPAGFVDGNRKFIYSPATKTTSVYDLSSDPLEQVRIELPEQQAREVADEIIRWRKNTILRLNQKKNGRQVLFDRWLCRWGNRVSRAKYIGQERE